MWLKKDLPDGRQVQRIFIPKGFDWVKTISPMLSKAGEGPVMWCPVTHFGYLESGSMGIKFKDDPDNIKIIKVGRRSGNQISRASPPARHRASDSPVDSRTGRRDLPRAAGPHPRHERGRRHDRVHAGHDVHERRGPGQDEGLSATP